MTRWSVGMCLIAVAACGSPPPPRLAPAGAALDDGTGQLAAASVRLRLGAEGQPDPFAAHPAELSRPWSADDDLGFGHGGVVYGGFLYGGFAYGGVGYGGIGFGAGPSSPLAQPPPYRPAGTAEGSTVTGTVRWRSDAGVVWPSGCAAVQVAHAGEPVIGALVYLDGVRAGRAVPVASQAARTGGVVEVGDCALTPAVQSTHPLPSRLVIENRAAAKVSLTGERAATQLEVELQPGGHQALVIERVGLTRIADGARAPAWVMGQASPYHVITGDRGDFTLDEVPPGTHELVIWHPPMVLDLGADGPRWSAPSTERRKIVVPRHGLVRLDVKLVPAS